MKKFLMKAGWSLLGLLLLLFAISLLIPAQISVERSIRIDAPLQIVFDQVNILHNWEKWSPWRQVDPMMELSYSNPSSGKGAFVSWKSTHKKIGNGRATLTDVFPQRMIVLSVASDRGMATSTMEFAQDDRLVTVTWSKTRRIGNNPVKKYRSIAMKRQMRKMFDQGLQGIKRASEQR